MAKNMQIIQFMAIQRAPLLYRLLKQALCQECIIILDLEDTLRDIDTKKTKSLKAWGRLELIRFAHSYPDIFKNKKVGLRVNGLKSGELEHDLKTITEISQIWDLHCIVGPKIESTENIQEYLSCLKNKKVCYKIFIPIVETLKGVNNLSSIASHESIKEVVYGHNDYSLDLRHWPFFEQDEKEFWQIASPFIQKVEEAGIRYIHPPISHLSNEAFFTEVYLRLQTECRFFFSITTINSAQTALFNHLKNAPLQIKQSELRSSSYSLQEKIDQALYVKKICSGKKRNFGIDPRTNTFFSPHKYMAALQFLGELNG
ncbi:MAG: hypothetical protein HZB76_01680 [Chlamydiae bacterium]|nr:hypothetical protein [Chlamydiota bacterium]